MKKSTENEAVFHACINDVPEICRVVTEAARESGMDDKGMWKLELALDEACTNIACYGYQNNCEGTIRLHWECRGDDFYVTIEDEGLPFDQSEPTDPDFSSDICQRKAGGLGRYIMRKFLDDLSYQRSDNKNTLILVKKLINTEDSD
ncbi:MAG: ATP-binding protein [Candidatus Omnitrophota bacterium]|jgi:anti-sigma regulatory factor (Ser/Thr protein kinase)|nr:MAG: ATP-binding protein [Candidatus Omnitrophota bacterium]